MIKGGDAMKKSVLLILLALLLTGCAVPEQEMQQPEAPQSMETFFRESSVDHHDPRWTEQELLTAFYQYAELGTEVIDCVIFEESACNVAGVVQYTQEGEEGCWFDFVKGDGVPRSTGSESSPAGEDTLVCTDMDTVQCKLLDENGEVFTCEVTYFEESDENTIGFKLVSR